MVIADAAGDADGHSRSIAWNIRSCGDRRSRSCNSSGSTRWTLQEQWPEQRLLQLNVTSYRDSHSTSPE